MTFSIATRNIAALRIITTHFYCYIVLNIAMLIVTMLNAVMLNVVMRNVMVPDIKPQRAYIKVPIAAHKTTAQYYISFYSRNLLMFAIR